MAGAGGRGMSWSDAKTDKGDAVLPKCFAAWWDLRNQRYRDTRGISGIDQNKKDLVSTLQPLRN
jgi:hypothetical protein